MVPCDIVTHTCMTPSVLFAKVNPKLIETYHDSPGKAETWPWRFHMERFDPPMVSSSPWPMVDFTGCLGAVGGGRQSRNPQGPWRSMAGKIIDGKMFQEAMYCWPKVKWLWLFRFKIFKYNPWQWRRKLFHIDEICSVFLIDPLLLSRWTSSPQCKSFWERSTHLRNNQTLRCLNPIIFPWFSPCCGEWQLRWYVLLGGEGFGASEPLQSVNCETSLVPRKEWGLHKSQKTILDKSIHNCFSVSFLHLSG